MHLVSLIVNPELFIYFRFSDVETSAITFAAIENDISFPRNPDS